MIFVLVWAVATTFSVEVRGPAWQVESLSQTLAVDLADHELTYAATGGELNVAIVVADRELRYVLSRVGAAPVRGAVGLGTVDRRALAGVIKDALHRMIPRTDAPVADVDVPDAAPSFGAYAALAALAALLVFPVFLSRGRATGRLLAGIAGVAIAGVAITQPIANAVLFAVGGLAWGLAFATLVPNALPLFSGLHRVEHRELPRVLGAWVALAALRSAWVGAWLAAIFGVLWLVCRALDVPDVVTFGVIAPLVLLCARLVWRALVEWMAARLDREVAEADEAWHPQVHGYFVGYLRRANLDVDEDVLARMKFLPGRDPERVLVYGGGYTHTRVVIGRAMLERALAPYGRPHDYAMPRVSTLHWMHWNSGLVMPSHVDEKLATRADRAPHHIAEEAAPERVALGEPPTLTGVIEPTKFDPRTSYRPNEDPLWLSWDPGEEFDGTDAGDKDFLFGLLVHAMGVAQRHEDRLATFVYVSKRRVPAWLTRARDTIADLHAALGGARHHLAQYLAWQIWRREDLLTARAYVPQLEAKSRAILAALDADADEGALHDRLRALRRFIDPRAVIERTKRQRVALAFAMVAVLAVIAGLVVEAALYSSTYEERRSDGKRS